MVKVVFASGGVIVKLDDIEEIKAGRDGYWSALTSEGGSVRLGPAPSLKELLADEVQDFYPARPGEVLHRYGVTPEPRGGVRLVCKVEPVLGWLYQPGGLEAVTRWGRQYLGMQPGENEIVVLPAEDGTFVSDPDGEFEDETEIEAILIERFREEVEKPWR